MFMLTSPIIITFLLQRFNIGMAAGAKTLRIATLSLVYSTAEYCAPVWCRSAHTLLIDSVLNDALRIVTGSHSKGPPTCTLRHPAS